MRPCRCRQLREQSSEAVQSHRAQRVLLGPHGHPQKPGCFQFCQVVMDRRLAQTQFVGQLLQGQRLRGDELDDPNPAVVGEDARQLDGTGGGGAATGLVGDSVFSYWKPSTWPMKQSPALALS